MSTETDTEKAERQVRQVQIEMTDMDDEDEEETLLTREKVPQRSTLKTCCRVSMILSAVVVFVIMLVQLWTNYGEYIQNRVMSPSIIAAGEFDTEGARSEFIIKFHKWEENVLHLNMTEPTSYIVQTNAISEYNGNSRYTWSDGCLQIQADKSKNINVFIWSL